MKNRCLLVAGAAVTAILALSSMTALVSAEDGVTTPTNPGFAPNTGQINRGIAQQLSSQSSDVPNMPTPEEARAIVAETEEAERPRVEELRRKREEENEQ